MASPGAQGIKVERIQPTATSLETQPITMNTQSGEIATDDPFAAQRTTADNLFRGHKDDLGVVGLKSDSQTTNAAPVDRRMSKEWDASKVPPSRFQKREGSIYATQGSRDGHVEKNVQSAYLEKLKEKKWS